MRKLALVVVLALSVTACASGGQSPSPPPSPSTPAPDVAFEATMTQEPKEIVVRWSLTNTSGDELLVPNLVPDSYGRFSTTADTVYVVPGTDTDVEIAKKVFDSTGDAGDSLPLVGFTRLKDGARIREVVRVPLPLSSYSPNGGATVPPAAASAVFCVGVVSPPFIPSMGFHQDGEIETMNHGVAASQQHVFCSEPLALS